jgi:hypothetical protein
MLHLLILTALYFLPTLVANSRHLPERSGIFFLNLFLGWTCIGWIIALVWAITATSPYAYYVHPQYSPRRW